MGQWLAYVVQDGELSSARIFKTESEAVRCAEKAAGKADPEADDVGVWDLIKDEVFFDALEEDGPETEEEEDEEEEEEPAEEPEEELGR
jgi:hypothetical protein